MLHVHKYLKRPERNQHELKNPRIIKSLNLMPSSLLEFTDTQLCENNTAHAARRGRQIQNAHQKKTKQNMRVSDGVQPSVKALEVHGSIENEFTTRPGA